MKGSCQRRNSSPILELGSVVVSTGDSTTALCQHADNSRRQDPRRRRNCSLRRDWRNPRGSGHSWCSIRVVCSEKSITFNCYDTSRVNIPVVERTTIEGSFTRAQKLALVEADDGNGAFDVALTQSSPSKYVRIANCENKYE